MNALFDLDSLTTPPPPCDWCHEQPAAVRVRTRPNLLNLGHTRQSHISNPCCEPCGNYLTACWQISPRLPCGQFRDLEVIWLVPFEKAGAR